MPDDQGVTLKAFHLFKSSQAAEAAPANPTLFPIQKQRIPCVSPPFRYSGEMETTLPPVRKLIDGAEVHPLDILQELHMLFTEAREGGIDRIESKLGAHFEARVLASWELYADDWLTLPETQKPRHLQLRKRRVEKEWIVDEK